MSRGAVTCTGVSQYPLIQYLGFSYSDTTDTGMYHAYYQDRGTLNESLVLTSLKQNTDVSLPLKRYPLYPQFQVPMEESKMEP